MSINYTNALKRYLNETASWEKCLGHDEYGKVIYDEAEEIAVRRIPMQKIVVDGFDSQAVSKVTVLTHAKIEAEDLIDGERVVSVEWSVDRFGRNIARQGYI